MQHFFNQSTRVNCSKYIICSNVLQRVSIHPSFWCKFWVSFKSSWGWSSLLTSRIVVNLFRAARTALWILCMVLVFLIAFSKLCLWFWLFFAWPLGGLAFPLPLKKPTRNCPTTYFLGRWNPSITATVSICVSNCFLFSEHFLGGCHKSPKRRCFFQCFLMGTKSFNRGSPRKVIVKMFNWQDMFWVYLMHLLNELTKDWDFTVNKHFLQSHSKVIKVSYSNSTFKFSWKHISRYPSLSVDLNGNKPTIVEMIPSKITHGWFHGFMMFRICCENCNLNHHPGGLRVETDVSHKLRDVHSGKIPWNSAGNSFKIQDCDLFYVQTYVALFLVMQCDVFVCLFVCLFVFLLKEAQANDSQTWCPGCNQVWPGLNYISKGCQWP